MRLNYWWRRVVTIFCFVCYACIGVVLALLALPIAYGGIELGVKTQRRMRYVIHLLCRLLIFVLELTGCMRLHARNIALFRQSGAKLIIANHPTYLDVVILLGLLPDALCVVKSSALQWPWSRSFIKLAGYISNNLPEQVLQDCLQNLNLGNVIILFPEGTRSPAGQLGMFQRGLANIALRADCPILPVALNCNPLSLGKQQAWHTCPERAYDYTVTVEPPLVIDEIVDLAHPLQVRVRLLTDALHQYFYKKLTQYGYLGNTN